MSSKKIITFFYLCCLTNAVFAQIKIVKVGLSPANVLTPGFSSAIQPSVEFSLSKRLHLLTESAIILKRADEDADYSNKKFFRIKIEARYQKKTNSPYYFGLQIAYSLRKFDDLNNGLFYNSKSDTLVYNYQSASISSPVFTVTLQYGVVFKLFSKFYGDFFIGTGYRNVNTKYSNINDLQTERNYVQGRAFAFAPRTAYQMNGMVHRLQLNGGLRVLYQLNKLKKYNP